MHMGGLHAVTTPWSQHIYEQAAVKGSFESHLPYNYFTNNSLNFDWNPKACFLKTQKNLGF